MLLLPQNEESPILLLSRNKPTNGTTYIMEITKVANEISSLFGVDIQKLGEVQETEFKEDNWVGRSWKVDNTKFKLVSINGHFQLYIEQEESQQAT